MDRPKQEDFDIAKEDLQFLEKHAMVRKKIRSGFENCAILFAIIFSAAVDWIVWQLILTGSLTSPTKDEITKIFSFGFLTYLIFLVGAIGILLQVQKTLDKIACRITLESDSTFEILFIRTSNLQKAGTIRQRLAAFENADRRYLYCPRA